MKKNNLVLKAAIAMLTFGAFSVVSNFANSNSVYAMDTTNFNLQPNVTQNKQLSYHSQNWHVSETQLTNLKKEAYKRMYGKIPSNETLNKIYVSEDSFTKNLNFYIFNDTLSNSGKIMPYSFTYFNTLSHERNNNESSNSNWNF